MPFLHNIRTVARYEATTLRRSWFFRLFSLGALFIFTIFNIAMFSPVGDEQWNLVSIPSSLPLVNLYLLNIAQSIVVIFLAADFLKRDKKVDTNEVLYTRSMSNFEYVMGKTIGILRLFIGLDIIILLIGFLINVISKSMTVDLLSYMWYLLIICVPTIFFSLGLAFMLMSVIRNQAITFLILLGLAALDIFWLWYRFGSIFDYMAFGLPVFKSTIVGFDNLGLLLNQRLLYFFLGLTLVLSTVLQFKRLPQSRLQTTLTYILIALFISGSVICGYNTYSFYKNDVNDKKLVIQTNRQFENSKFVSLTSAYIDFIHKGSSFEATARLKFINDYNENLEKYIFSLNPGLTVTNVSSNGNELKFKKINHIIEINALVALASGKQDSIVISYSGTINESFCYPNYSDNLKESSYRIEMLNVNKRQAFMTRDYILLTPETHWYPVPGLNFYPANPARIKVDFTNFYLRVMTSEGLYAVAQGNMKKENGWFCFTPESPLTGLTLAVGNYQPDTLKVDSVRYIAYHFPGHDYYKKDLAELKDTLPLLVSGIMRELETNFSTKYPFKTLSLLEVPVQFYSYPRMSTQTRAELQPSMVLLPEKLSTIQNAGFKKQFSRQKKRMTNNNQIITDKELEVRLFNSFIRNTFISGENFSFRNGVAVNEPTRYRLGPSFYFFKNNFYSSEYPVINAVFETHLQKVETPGQGSFAGTMGGLTDNDQANIILKNISFRDLMSTNPGSDTIRKVLSVKGDYLFNMFRAKAGIDEFKDWFAKYIDDNEFKSVSIEQLNKDINKKFGFEFYPYLNEWFNNKKQPGFSITNLQVSQIVVDTRSRYQVTFIASNPENVAGLFNVSFRTGGQGGMGGMGGGGGPMMMGGGGQGGGRGNFAIAGQGRGMEASDISKIVFVGPGEAKKVGIVLDAQPRAMMINTLFSKNIPGQLTIAVNELGKAQAGAKPFEGEEILPSIQDYINPSEIIVDNEDPGFIINKQTDTSPLKKLFKINNNNGESYRQIDNIYAPEYWQSVVQSSYYGKYILSSVYTKAGTGNKEAMWKTPVKEPGYYTIYFYVGKTMDRMSVRGGGMGGPGGGGPGGGGPGGGGPGGGGPGGGRTPGGDQPGRDSPYQDMHLKIYHDEGIEEMTFDYQSAESGWNNLGRFYISSDTAKIVLTNLSAGKIVIADAVKWVKED
jgi:ABC-type transport system involved in multi-copper enzyme maturation permease subunit